MMEPVMAEQTFTNLTNAGPVSVTVRDDKIIRVRPLAADPDDFKPWSIEADGKTYSPPKKFNISPFAFGER